MRQALRPNRGRSAVARPVVVSAPTKGWSANTLPMEAEEGTAIILENFFPEATSLRPRRGFTEQVHGIASSVETLMAYTSGTTQKLFAAGAAKIYDVSSVGALGAAVQSGLGSTKFSYVNFATAGGHYLYMVNAADAARYYDGSAWTNPAITGATSSTFSFVTSHKSRLWFIQSGTSRAWYLPVDSIAGAATSFEVGSQLRRGGHLVAAGSWSVDAGNGMDDLLAFWSSEGEVLVYAGTNPSSDYALVGRYQAARPVGDRCLFPIGGDLAMLSEEGVLSMSNVMRLDQISSADRSLSSQIVDAYRQVVRDYAEDFGWQMVAYPKLSMAMVNIPGAGDAGASIQFAYNVTTKAWCKFTGMDALCWELFDGEIYFGTAAGAVYRAEDGGNDNGAAITARCLPAFSHFGAPGLTKHVKQVQPLFSTDLTNYSIGSLMIANFGDPGVVGSSGAPASSAFTWDVSVWDGPALWLGTFVWDIWDGADNMGYVLAPYAEVTIDAASAPLFKFSLIGWNLLVETGGLAFTA